MEINGKEFVLNNNIRWGILENIYNRPQDPKVIRAFIREVLIPSPTDKEIFNFTTIDIVRIMDEFNKFQEELVSEVKKKRSRS